MGEGIMKRCVAMLLMVSLFGYGQWKQTSLEGNINGLIERNNSLFAATSAGLFVSTDGGNSFQTINLPSPSGPKYTYSFTHFGDTLLVSTGQGILMSKDNDTVWTSVYPSFSYGYLFNFFNVLIDEVSGTFYRSTTKGTSWEQLSTPAPEFFNYSFTSDSSRIYYGSAKGIFISSDSGATWKKSNTGLKGDTSILSLVSIYGKIIASTNVDTNRIYQSLDSGASWQRIAENPAPGFIKQMFVVGGSIFGNANYGKLYCSTDDGVTWVNVHSGLSNSISTISSHTVILDTLYIGTGSSSGVWKRSLSDFGITSVSDRFPEAPENYILKQNYPNPFNPTTNIQFSLRNAGFASVKVFDMLGREVATVVSGEMNGGAHTVSFDAGHLTSGVYFYQLRSGTTVETKRMILLK